MNFDVYGLVWSMDVFQSTKYFIFYICNEQYEICIYLFQSFIPVYI